MLDTAIIGGGLTGLSLANSLSQAGRSFSLYESRNRFGGRVYSVAAEPLSGNDVQSFKFDLGPSWVWPDYQPRIAKFLQQNHIAVIPQWTKGRSLYQSDNNSPAISFDDESPYVSARRIIGGSECLIEALLRQLPPNSLNLDYHLNKVFNHGNAVELHFNVNGVNEVIRAKQVVITVPPRLAASSIQFLPEMDQRFISLMKNTATWMAGQAKAVICYQEPFWRLANYSGSAFAAYPGAALSEMFDVSMENGMHSALSGFFALSANRREKYRDDLEALILAQLVSIYGKPAASAKKIIIKDWAIDPLTSTVDDEEIPSKHPQYGHAWFQLDHWNEKLYFAGSETASEFGGYLEGALESAERVAKSLEI